MFEGYLTRWMLTADGEPLITRSSHLLPVRHQGMPAMLKVAIAAEEKSGGSLMAWWQGHGAAPVLKHDIQAVLLARADSTAGLIELVRRGQDDTASCIICSVVAQLHAPRAAPMPRLVPLAEWFSDLEPAARRHGGVLSASAAIARELLADPRDVGVLHGDIHHANILDFGAKGWLAIDPKGLLGERGFDYANLFRNPDHAVAIQPGRFARQVELVATTAGLECKRLLRWIAAGIGLSAAWHMDDGERLDTSLAVIDMALAALTEHD